MNEAAAAVQNSGESELELFRRYKENKSIALRNEIVMRSMNIAKYAVLSTRNMYAGSSDAEDIENEAVLALMSAVDSFDPDKNVKFTTYASIKIRGAIIDYIRKSDIIPRSVRRFAKEYDKAYGELYSQLDREPNNSEIAEYMGISLAKLESFCARSASAQAFSFEEMILNGFDVSDDVSEGYEAERKLIEKERRQQLIQAISLLNDSERTVITLYYYEKLKYSDIAKVLDVSESRVCQIHSKAVKKLREVMEQYM